MGSLTDLKRSIGVQAFLHRTHGPVTRHLVGATAALAARLVTGEALLAAEIRRRIARDDAMKIGLRRLSWYLRRRHPRHLEGDAVFDFTRGLTPAECAAADRFLATRARGDAAEIAADRLHAAAAALLHDPRDDSLYRARGDALISLILAQRPQPRAPRPLPPQPRFAADRAARALADLAAAAPIDRFPWFILSGTFLGLIREGGFLPHDYDIDIGITVPDADPEALVAAIAGHPAFAVKSREDMTTLDAGQRRDWPVLAGLVHDSGTHIDLFIHHRDGDTIWHGTPTLRWDNASFTLVRYTLAGTEVWGPADADRYLTENYGAWRVPVTDFHSAVDTANQRVAANPLSVATFLRRALVEARRNPAACDGLMRILAREGHIVAEGGGWRMAGGRFA